MKLKHLNTMVMFLIAFLGQKAMAEGLRSSPFKLVVSVTGATPEQVRQILDSKNVPYVFIEEVNGETVAKVLKTLNPPAGFEERVEEIVFSRTSSPH